MAEEIGILCPSRFEYNALDRNKLHKLKIEVVCSGMGKVRSVLGAMNLYERCHNLKHVLLIGFVGGLTTDLQIGDIVEPDIFIEQDYNCEPFEKFPNKIKSSARRKLLSESKRATILTQDRFLTDNPYSSKDSGRVDQTIVCDMESYAVAKFCREKKIRLAVVKLVSDVADQNASHDFLAACKKLAPKLNRIALRSARKLCLW